MYELVDELNTQLEKRKQYTTIVKIGMTPAGQYCVGRSEPMPGFLDRDEILKAIPSVEFAPVTSENPFFFRVKGRQRLVFTLAVDSWFFQPTIAPFTLKTPDPLNNFVNQTKLQDDPLGYGRSKTIYVDDENKIKQEKPYVYNLFIDVWQDPNNIKSAVTPVIIDPDIGNDGEDGDG